MYVHGTKVFYSVIDEFARKESERVKISTVLDKDTYLRVIRIIEEQPLRKREAFYGTIYEAAVSGRDFSEVQSLEDIAGIYASYLLDDYFSEGERK